MRETADVVVVGGGIIGCSVALQLARLGADVLLLERAEIASAASGRNHGLIFYPQERVADPLYQKSREIYGEIRDTSDIAISFDSVPKGFIIAVSSEDEWESAEAEAKACQEGGIKVERIDDEQIVELEPNIASGHLGGYYVDDGYRLDPAALTAATALAARDSGAEVLTHVDVKQILVRDRKVKGVASDQGVVRAGAVVDAAGPWAPKLARPLGVDLPIVGARGWLLLTRATEPVANHLLESSGWHLTAGDAGPAQVSVEGYANKDLPAPADIGLIIQQNETGHILLGGSRLASMREDPEGIDVTYEIAGRAVAMLPVLASIPLLGVWSGVRPMTPDGLPLIGWLPGIEGFFVCGGHGGQGVMLGGGSGLLAAQLIAQTHAFMDPNPFDPSRFGHSS